MRKKKIKFIDAQKMAKENPETFYAPSSTELDKIKKGNSVKIAISKERFWVTVVFVNNNKITGTIDNDLIFTDEHGLQFEDEIEFEKKNIYSIFSM